VGNSFAGPVGNAHTEFDPLLHEKRIEQRLEVLGLAQFGDGVSTAALARVCERGLESVERHAIERGRLGFIGSYIGSLQRRRLAG